ncbi:MAG TPA: head GIN domain-containing protein [Chitinophagaceae bacterium]
MMKRILFIAFLAISIKSIGAGIIKGNGISKTEKREVGSFSGLSSSGLMDVTIAYGNSTGITLKGDENILPYVETFVKDGRLKIKVKDFTIIRPKLSITVHVSMTTINSVSQSGSGSITGEGNFSNDGETGFSMSGSGKIKLGFEKFGNAAISMSGSGSVELKGNISNNLSVHQSGSGHVDCEDAPSTNVSVQISGSGNTRINATKEITAHISGSGSVYYTGNATIAEQHISGSGGLRKI